MPMTSISLKPESEIRMKIAFAAFALIALFVKDVRCILDYEDTFKTQISQANIIVTQVEAEIGSLGGLDNINAKIDDIKVDLQRDVNNSNVMEGIKSIHDLLDHKSELLEGVSSSELTKVKIEGLLEGLGVQMDNLMSTLFDALETDVEEKLKKLNLDKIPEDDIKKLEPLSKVVTSLITNLTETAEVPTAITDITKKVETFVNDGDILNAVKSARQINSTFLKDFPSLSVQQLSMLDDFEVAAVALHSGVDTMLDARVAAQTSTDNSHNEGTMTEWGVGTVVISALLCMEIHGTF